MSDAIPVPVCVVRLPEGFTQLLSLTQLYLNDAFLEFLPASFGRSVCSPVWIRMKLFLTEQLIYTLYTVGMMEEFIPKIHIFPPTCAGIIPTELLWCELQSFRDITCWETSKIMELGGTRLVPLKMQRQNTLEKLFSNVSYQECWPAYSRWSADLVMRTVSCRKYFRFVSFSFPRTSTHWEEAGDLSYLTLQLSRTGYKCFLRPKLSQSQTLLLMSRYTLLPKLQLMLNQSRLINSTTGKRRLSFSFLSELSLFKCVIYVNVTCSS